MEYKELQRELKEMREAGKEVKVKLNSKKEVLKEEYKRLTEKKGKEKRVNGVVIHRGVSSIDNKTEIVVIATGINKKTANPKTGEMIQTWILVENTYPTEAIDSGKDEAICGNCPHRKNTETGKRTCYVNMMGVASVYKAYKEGKYPEYEEKEHGKMFEGKKIRYGAYGDPVLIPIEVVEHFKGKVKGHTGYTHQWREEKNREYKKYYMASVDTLIDFCEADAKGWSTFRVLPQGVESTGIGCQGGVKTDCNRCSLCSGSEDRQKHVSINAHGKNGKLVK